MAETLGTALCTEGDLFEGDGGQQASKSFFNKMAAPVQENVAGLLCEMN